MGIGALRRYHAKGKADATPSTGSVASARPDDEPTEKWKVDELKAHAVARGIELDGVTKKADILKALAEAASAPTPPAGDEANEGKAGEGEGEEPS